MAKHVARYLISYGQPSYMPDSYAGPYECHTRREMAEMIRDTLALYGWPARLFHEAGLRDLWRKCQAMHGFSCAHFSLYHGDFVMTFHGLTEDEYIDQSTIEW